MKPYTVLLLYPDYASENYGEETYMTSLEAESVVQAQELAQRECAEGYFSSVYTGEADTAGDVNSNFTDWAVLMVIEGQHADIKEVE